MEVDFVTSDILDDEETVEFDDNNNNFSFDGERCGICMEIVIDRGVLDCCQHWFCFGCIDNWSTITNLCPLCQNEFQLITCVPVYDTIGSNKVDEDSFSRDDEWSIEGNGNNLSFPSYYIDENAVTCLDGDGCKVRSGSAVVEEDSGLDTSIACDSCDIWYHAFCVGFDTESTTDDTWLCPRCTVDESPQKSDVSALLRPNFQCGSEASDMSCFADGAFAGKVSVSVADAGETAIVVSMVREDKHIKDLNENSQLSLKAAKDLKVAIVHPHGNSINEEMQTAEETETLKITDGQKIELSLSCDTSFGLKSDSSQLSELNSQCADGAMNGPSTSSHAKISLGNQSSDRNKLSVSESSGGLHLGLSVGNFQAVNIRKSNEIEDKMSRDVLLQSHLEESGPKGKEENDLDENLLADTDEQALRTVGMKRKHMDTSDVNETADDEAPSSTDDVVVSVKEIKLNRMEPSLEKQDVSLVPSDFQPPLAQITISDDDKTKHSTEKENATIDVMSIVQDTGHRKRIARRRLLDKSSKERESAVGLRVKKIMRRTSDDKDSTIEVQKLRKEIREAVRNRSSADIGENLFDPKLLAAFRTAVTGPITEPVKKLPPAALRAKKLMLQKGKVRENLTKKIYANTNGKRRRAWDRDCEVEFWKHRCVGATKPEKVATLKSVLNLLKRNPEDSVIEQVSESSAANTILSRLYLADTSVFPRKADIKPLSDLSAISNAEQNKTGALSSENVENTSVVDHASKNSEANKILEKIVSVSSHEKVLKTKMISSQGKAAYGTPSAGSKVNIHKDTGLQPDDKKIDKRKWAMEVLARKKAAAGANLAGEKQESNMPLKGNYPLLAQLPADMRPVLAPSCHNKVPISVRQGQLYRLAEHFIKKLNLPEIRRTAETELAVADAINIEKAVADRSNSKLVYLNLCSQEILHFSDKKSVRSTEGNSSTEVVLGSNDIAEQSSFELPTDPAVLDALKNAGLLSDSPPGSPSGKLEAAVEAGGSTSQKKEDGPENILEIDSHLDTDIYGDFEYDLEDEDYIGVGAKKASNSEAEEADSRVIVVFSTLKPEKSDLGQQLEEKMRMENVDTAKYSPSLPKSPTNTVIISSTMEGAVDKSSVSSTALPVEASEEISLVECEELYGPDEEPLVNEVPGVAPTILNGVVNTESVLENNIPVETGNNIGCRAENTTHAIVGCNSCHREKSPGHSQTSENIPRKDKSTAASKKRSGNASSVSKKVESYIKEHIRPLCKSGVITVEQYRWAVTKTADKVMKYHTNATTANFLIREGEKVKKLAEQYIETAKQKEKVNR